MRGRVGIRVGITVGFKLGVALAVLATCSIDHVVPDPQK